MMPEEQPNDLPPESDAGNKEQPLSNADFRRLISDKPQKGGSGGGDLSRPAWKSHKAEGPKKGGQRPGRHGHKKKSSKAVEKDEDEESLNRILRNYRDRAKERRDIEENPEFQASEVLQATSGYRAVAPDARATLDAQERRKRMIQESKYLGGDMEHTHLVKGLDFALLQKVRSEITSKEKDDELESAYTGSTRTPAQSTGDLHDQIKHKVARGIYNVLFSNDHPKVNQVFAPRRMAYVIELDDDVAESDIPTTLLRSKAECPPPQNATNLSANDMVIQKLTQVLSYLRTDTSKKRSKRDKEKQSNMPIEGLSITGSSKKAKEKGGASGGAGTAKGMAIYDDVGEYNPSSRSGGGGNKESGKRGPYFEKPSEHNEDRHRDRHRDRERDREREREPDRERRDRGRTQDTFRGRRAGSTDRRLQEGWAPADISFQRQQQEGYNPRAELTKEEKDSGMASVFKRDRDPLAVSSSKKDGIKFQAKNPDCYAECYPDAFESYDALGDSDDEADFSRMDLGNKKGLIRRWDFDTEQEYEEYMSQREALPKAAFQYGVKMNDGRKTRKIGGGPKTERDEKMKLDREWQKISNIISKRKEGGARSHGEPSTKKFKS